MAEPLAAFRRDRALQRALQRHLRQLTREHRPDEMCLARGRSFSKLNNSNDPTSNELPGINKHGHIAGYFGFGRREPEQGLCAAAWAGLRHSRTRTSPPGIQTQVIGFNDTGASVGFWSIQNTKSMTKDNFGFDDWHGQFDIVTSRRGIWPSRRSTSSSARTTRASRWFSTWEAKGQAHSYADSIPGGWFHRIRLSGVDEHDRVRHQQPGRHRRLHTGRGGVTRGFCSAAHGHLTGFTVPGSSSTMAFGVNDQRRGLGTYMVGNGNNAKSFGFIWSRRLRIPDGSTTRTVTGPRAQRHQQCRRPGRLRHRCRGQHRRPAGGAGPLPGAARPAADDHDPDAGLDPHGYADRDHHAGPCRPG